MHECFPKHSCSYIAAITAIFFKKYIETEEESKKRKVNMERSTAGKKICPDRLTVARATVPAGSLFPEAVNELLNENNQHP